ncbi:exonuclease domain-containing protein [Streptomyces sp. NPDC006265]|uniref:exonuclease domain-containing protein n=1 Tax=Streptomyces sp. NPDC006265 TaxID=3156740 RepID=UPI0033A75F84
MQLQQTDIRAAAFVSVPSRTLAADGGVIGPEQAARYLGLHRRELGYLLEAGLLAPSGRSVAGTVRFAVSALDAVAAQPLDWAAARSAEGRRPSPWRELAGPASERARLVDGVTAALRADGVDAWARYSAAADRWTLDWAPAHDGGPSRGEVMALLPLRLARAVDAQRVVLLGPVGQTMHWAHDMLQPGVACVVDVETTGLTPADRVIEVAAVDAHDGSVLIDTLVHPGPGITIPAGATRVHGITDTMVAGARPWSVVLPEVLAAVGERVLLAYNSDFDKRMTLGHARALGCDPGRLRSAQAWQCLMKRRSMWLSTTTRLKLGGRHRALGDAIAARELLLSLRGRPPSTLTARQPEEEQVPPGQAVDAPVCP